jgi:hypothetical protein
MEEIQRSKKSIDPLRYVFPRDVVEEIRAKVVQPYDYVDYDESNGVAVIDADWVGHPGLSCELNCLKERYRLDLLCLHCTRNELQIDWMLQCWKDLTQELGLAGNQVMILVLYQ